MIGKTLGESRSSSRIKWAREFGQMHWRNNLVVSDDRLFFSTSGSRWNSPDPKDAVWCVEAETGNPIWVVYTGADANSILLHEEVVLLGTDLGRVLAVDASDGTVVAELEAGEPVLTKPVLIASSGKKFGVLISETGTVIGYDFEKRRWSTLTELPYGVTATPVVVGNSFYIGTKSNEVLRLNTSDWSMEDLSNLHSDPAGRYRVSPTGIQSLLVSGENLVVSYARDTYDVRPPIVCVDAKTGNRLWQARGVKTLSKKREVVFGNARTLPVVWKGLLLATFAYNDSLHAFDLRTGLGRWCVQLDEGYFQNWASAVLDGSKLYVPRVNGVISTVNLQSGRLEASLSIETANPARSETQGNQAGLGPREILEFGIASTPTVSQERLYVGTVAGRVLQVALPRSS